MIIYIHGFGSHGYGGKASALREYYASQDEEFIAPSLSYVPELALQTLEELMRVCSDVKLIGSSLGGYYTLYLAEKYGVKAILINPSIYPFVTLERLLGDTPNYYDESRFEWRESHIDMLQLYKTEIKDPSKYMLMAQKDDEVLDFQEAVDKLAGATMIVEEGGDHGFVGIERHFEVMKEFLNRSR